MNYDQLADEMTSIYQDYTNHYAYAFINGMIYVSLVSKEINEDQAHELNHLNMKMFQEF